MYTPFSWDGMTDQTGYAPNPTVPYLQSNTPVFQEQDLPGGNAPQAATAVIGNYKNGLQFQVYRTVLQSASYHKQIVDQVSAAQPNLQVVDPLTLGYLARIALGGNNNDRVTYIDDSIPSTMTVKGVYNVSFTVRNEGWNILNTTTTDVNDRVVMTWVIADAAGEIYCNVLLNPGSSCIFQGSIFGPSTGGQNLLAYQLRRGPELINDFDNKGNPAWFKVINVT